MLSCAAFITTGRVLYHGPSHLGIFCTRSSQLGMFINKLNAVGLFFLNRLIAVGHAFVPCTLQWSMPLCSAHHSGACLRTYIIPLAHVSVPCSPQRLLLFYPSVSTPGSSTVYGTSQPLVQRVKGGENPLAVSEACFELTFSTIACS